MAVNLVHAIHYDSPRPDTRYVTPAPASSGPSALVTAILAMDVLYETCFGLGIYLALRHGICLLRPLFAYGASTRTAQSWLATLWKPHHACDLSIRIREDYREVFVTFSDTFSASSVAMHNPAESSREHRTPEFWCGSIAFMIQCNCNRRVWFTIQILRDQISC